MLCNRILSVRIVGQSKGTALVGLADQASPIPADVAELLISMGYAAPSTSPPDTEDTATPGAEGAAAKGRTMGLEEVLGVEERDVSHHNVNKVVQKFCMLLGAFQIKHALRCLA